MRNGKRSGESKAHGAIAAAWDALEDGLAEALAVMGDNAGQFLILTDERSSRYVQIIVKSGSELHAEAVSNHYLPASEALSAAEIVGMQDLGWSPPTNPPDAKAERGCSNFFRVFQRPTDFGAVARLAVRTLRDVFQVPFPARLHYDAFDRAGKAIIIPTLAIPRRASPSEGLARRTADGAETVESLQAKVFEAVKRASGNPELQLDKDQDLPVRFGSALVFVRIVGTPPFVSIFSPVLANVEERPEVLARLNEMNAKVRFARLFELEGTVYAAVEVFGTPFVGEHVASACAILGELANNVDEMLQGEFGGRTAFGQFRPGPAAQGGGTPQLVSGEGSEPTAERTIGFVGPSKS